MVNLLLIVEVVVVKLLPSRSTVFVLPPIMAVYQCILLPLPLLSNTQVNVVDLPSHTVASSGSLITVVNTYAHSYICTYSKCLNMRQLGFHITYALSM